MTRAIYVHFTLKAHSHRAAAQAKISLMYIAFSMIFFAVLHSLSPGVNESLVLHLVQLEISGDFNQYVVYLM